jgi:hypothetical protein
MNGGPYISARLERIGMVETFDGPDEDRDGPGPVHW